MRSKARISLGAAKQAVVSEERCGCGRYGMFDALSHETHFTMEGGRVYIHLHSLRKIENWQTVWLLQYTPARL